MYAKRTPKVDTVSGGFRNFFFSWQQSFERYFLPYHQKCVADQAFQQDHSKIPITITVNSLFERHFAVCTSYIGIAPRIFSHSQWVLYNALSDYKIYLSHFPNRTHRDLQTASISPLKQKSPSLQILFLWMQPGLNN